MRWGPEAMRTSSQLTAMALRRRQGGAALVIGLILLLVLTLLAVSGMNSASLEFVMAGNEQFRANAFAAAETGIEQTLASGMFNPALPPQNQNGAATATDNWASTVTAQLGGNP